MTISAGNFLKATESLNETNFEAAVLFITEHNENGAIGFVINRPYHRNLNELIEFKNSVAFPLYEGGPVENEKVFFIHQRPDLIGGGTRINNGIFLGGNFKQAVSQINQQKLTENDVKIFIGYCGWDNDELEEEVREGSWSIVEDGTKNVFSENA